MFDSPFYTLILAHHFLIDVFYLGYICNRWVNQETGEEYDTFSIITTDAGNTRTNRNIPEIKQKIV